MSDTYEHWQEKCHCGQIIGDVGRIFRQLVIEQGLIPYEVATSLGYVKSCCLETLQTPTMSEVRTAHTGHISKKVLEPIEPIQIFTLKNLKILEMEESSDGCVSVSDHSEIENVDVKEEEDDAIYASIRDIKEPMVEPYIRINDMKRNDVVVTGYRRDTNGNPVMIDIGSGFYVPILTYMVRVAQNRPVGIFDQDINFLKPLKKHNMIPQIYG